MMPATHHTAAMPVEPNASEANTLEIERLVEMRLAERAQAEAVRWRFRLIVAEAIVLALAAGAAGAAMKQAPVLVLRGALLVGVGSLVTGVLAIAGAKAATRLVDRLRRRKQP